MEQLEVNLSSDTIVAVSTPPGTGGIAVIRISGPEAFSIVDKAWKGKSLATSASHTVHLGKYLATDGNILDEAVASVFRNPNSFTGEDVVELSVHGSKWIQREIISDLVKRGARVAAPGEFTQRAFLNGRLDLAQAEGVADLIASSSRAAHRLAITQTRGGFSKQLENLRQRLIDFASLLELELDFSEEDVEFADRSNLLALANEIKRIIRRLASSYSSGAVIKEGVPVVIAGVPNAGKSSLLNLILGDDKAIVSDIPGTTRDTIEDTVEINGILYRFIDTAGLRPTSDTIENLGIDRAKAKMRDAKIIVWIIDPTTPLQPQLNELKDFLDSSQNHPADASNIQTYVVSPTQSVNASNELTDEVSNLQSGDVSYIQSGEASHAQTDDKVTNPLPQNDGTDSKIQSLIILLNKSDIASQQQIDQTKTILSDLFHFNSERISVEKTLSANKLENQEENIPHIEFSTKTGKGLEELYQELNKRSLEDIDIENDIVITNARHYEALTKAQQSLDRAIEGIETGISADFIAQDVRETLHHLGTITGAITTPHLLQTIFSRFCIGK